MKKSNTNRLGWILLSPSLLILGIAGLAPFFYVIYVGTYSWNVFSKERGKFFVGIQNYPNNTLEIFNRWGNVVFEVSSYANEWDGYANKNVLAGKQKVPAGTYFYILNLGNGTKAVSGFVVIKY